MRNALYRLLLFLIALALGIVGAHAQGVGPYTPYRVDITGYKGNTVQSDSLTITPGDTLQQLTAVAMYREGNEPVPALAPTLIRKKLKLVVKWTLTPPFTDGWYQVRSGGQTIRYGAVRITTQGIVPPQANGNTIAAIIAQLAQSFGAGKLDVGTFNTFVSANTIALGLKFNTVDTTAFVRKYSGYRLMSTAEGVKLAGIATGATNVDSTLLVRKSTFVLEKAVLNAAIAKIAPREFETLASALSARATASTTPQQWVVLHDESYLINGVAQRQSYEWDGTELYYNAKQKADGSPGTPTYNTAIDNINATLSAKLGRVRVTTTANVTGTPTALTVYEVDSDTNTQGKAFYFLDSTGQKHIILTAPITP